VYIGPGGRAYVSGLKDKAKLWQVFRPTKPVIDPETQEPIGHEAFYLGTAKLVAEGDPATVDIVTAVQEIGVNDRLMPTTRAEIVSTPPTCPPSRSRARSQPSTAASRKPDALHRHTQSRQAGRGRTRPRAGHLSQRRRAPLPRRQRNQHRKIAAGAYGMVFVFRVFDRISYALVMDVYAAGGGFRHRSHARKCAGQSELAAWLRLTLAPGIGGETQRRLLSAFGLPAHIFAASAATLARTVCRSNRQSSCFPTRRKARSTRRWPGPPSRQRHPDAGRCDLSAAPARHAGSAHRAVCEGPPANCSMPPPSPSSVRAMPRRRVNPTRKLSPRPWPMPD
jgi:hypothetical protein